MHAGSMKLSRPSLGAMLFITIILYCIIIIFSWIKIPTEHWQFLLKDNGFSSLYRFCSVDKVYKIDFPPYNFTWWVYGIDADVHYNHIVFISATEGIFWIVF